jgi:transposase
MGGRNRARESSGRAAGAWYAVRSTDRTLTITMLMVTAPAALREQLAGLYKDRLIYACEQLPEPETLSTPTDAVTVAIKSLSARCRELDTEAARLERYIDTITATAAPQLRAIYGVGPDTAATVLAAIGDNSDRISTDAASPNSAESAHCYIASEIYHALHEPSRTTNELIA